MWIVVRARPAQDKIYVKTYSPYLNEYKTDPTNEFTLDYSMTIAWDIPELPLFLLLALIMIAMLLVAIIYRRTIKPEP